MIAKKKDVVPLRRVEAPQDTPLAGLFRRRSQHSKHSYDSHSSLLCTQALRTTLGTIGCVAGKFPPGLHFFRHRTELIEMLTRKAQQHRDLLLLDFA